MLAELSSIALTTAIFILTTITVLNILTLLTILSPLLLLNPLHSILTHCSSQELIIRKNIRLPLISKVEY